MPEISQTFTQGINRAVSREEFFNPEFFYTLQNCRILQTGRIGEIVRIKGFEKISTELDSLDTVYDFIRYEDFVVAFYRTVGGDYAIKIFDSAGTLQDAFSYSDDIVPDAGQLKQHEDSIFIAPHNKILYRQEGTFYLRDFISKLPRINNISTDDLNSQRAKYNISVGETLASVGGRRATGYIEVLKNNVPLNTEDTFVIEIGDDESEPVVISNETVPALVIAIRDTINNSPEFDGKWTAQLTTQNLKRIAVIANDAGTQNNNVRIRIRSQLTRSVDVDRVNPVTNFPFPTTPVNPFRPFEPFGGPDSAFTDRFESTFRIQSVKDGKDASSVSGTLRVGIKDAIVSRPIRILPSDSTSQIASKVQDAFNASSDVTQQYNVSRSTNTVVIEAKRSGKKFNTDVVATLNIDGDYDLELPDGFLNVSQVTEGTDSKADGTLEPFTEYWYKARFRYIDGHVTRTSPAKLVNSEENRVTSIVFNVPTNDLDNGFPNIQIFRKRAESEFFLIDDINLSNETISGGQFTYVDEGRSNIEPLVEVDSTWTKSHEVQEVMDNRYLKANLTFFDEKYNISDSDFTISTSNASDSDRDVAPYNSKALMYVRPQYTDGTKGFFKEIGQTTVEQESRKLRVQQNAVINAPEKDISELEFFAKYLPFGEEQSLRFNSVEIQSPALSGIEDPQRFPSQTKVFFGYKFISQISYTDGTSVFFTGVEGWDSERSEFPRVIGHHSDDNIVFLNNGRIRITIHGEKFTYVPVAVGDTKTREIPRDSFGNIADTTTTIYKLEMYDALEEAVSTGNLQVRIPRSNTKSLSSVVSDDDIMELAVKVTGIEDKSFGNNRFSYRDIVEGNDFVRLLVPFPDSRIYLILEDSILNEIDNADINKYEYKGRDRKANLADKNYPIELPIFETGTVPFRLINFQLQEEADYDFNERAPVFVEEDDYELIRDLLNANNNAKYLLINRDLSNREQVIYVGSKFNETDGSAVTLNTTGFVSNPPDMLRTNLFYSRLAPYNIYDQIIKETDFNFDRQEFNNQIIWSNPLLDGNYFSGGRNFSNENFYNVPTENGNIIDIVSLQGNVYAFCERGVAQLLVGEVLTQQKNGQVFVDSSGFITKHIWMLENTPPIHRDSIVKKDNAIYFADGNDVWRLGGQGLENISEGILDLDSQVTYFANYVSLYDEYRLCGDGKMFVYNTKYGQWYGPHTYTPFKSVELSDGSILSYKDSLIKEDVGNTFDGTPYTSIIQSVGNDTEVGAIDKTYRKFYISLDGDADTTFKYGKNPNALQTKTVSDLRVRNDRRHVGISNTEGNTKKIFWDMESTNADFALKGFRTSYHLRHRR